MHELVAPAQTLALLTTINAGIHELLDSPDDRAEALHALNNGLLSKVSLYTRAAGNRHQAIPPMDAEKQTYQGGICGAITENLPQGLAVINAAACWLLAIQAAVVGHLKAISS